MMLIENKFDLGQLVYLKTDYDQSPRFVTAINIRPGRIIYGLVGGTVESWHDDFEISLEKSTINVS